MCCCCCSALCMMIIIFACASYTEHVGDYIEIEESMRLQVRGAQTNGHIWSDSIRFSLFKVRPVYWSMSTSGHWLEFRLYYPRARASYTLNGPFLFLTSSSFFFRCGWCLSFTLRITLPFWWNSLCDLLFNQKKRNEIETILSAHRRLCA